MNAKNKKIPDKIPDTDEAWDEGTLGREEAFVAVAADQEAEKAFINESLGLQPISIRLHKSLIEDFKMIADLNGGIGYQTLMRQVLQRFAECEIKKILREVALEKEKAVEKEAADRIAAEESRKVA